MHNSAILYSGPSELDGAPIVAIITGLSDKSSNPKTGGMAQTWILRADISPLDAVRARQDGSICGDCLHRGDETRARSCYVVLKNAPTAVYRAYTRGSYPTLTPRDANAILRARGLSVRLGSYGDPAAIPAQIWHDLTDGVRYTGYTHAWRAAKAKALRGLCMASCDSTRDVVDAKMAGWRTFRVAPELFVPGRAEIMCPASEEAGKRTTCSACNLCNGARESDARRDIAIVAHGSFKGSFIRLASVQ